MLGWLNMRSPFLAASTTLLGSLVSWNAAVNHSQHEGRQTWWCLHE